MYIQIIGSGGEVFIAAGLFLRTGLQLPFVLGVNVNK